MHLSFYATWFSNNKTILLQEIVYLEIIKIIKNKNLKGIPKGPEKVEDGWNNIYYCRSISAKPTSIQKEKDIPRLPEN